MGAMVVDVTTLKSNCQQLDQEIATFKNKACTTFQQSYINTCSEPVIQRMAANLRSSYSNLGNSFSNISSWFNGYINNMSGVESKLSGNNARLCDGFILSLMGDIPKLSEYNIKFGKIYATGIKPVNNPNFANNLVHGRDKNFVESRYYSTPKERARMLRFIGTGTNIALGFCHGVVSNIEALSDGGFVLLGLVDTFVAKSMTAITGYDFMKGNKETWKFVRSVTEPNEADDLFNNRIYKNTENLLKEGYYRDEINTVSKGVGSASTIVATAALGSASFGVSKGVATAGSAFVTSGAKATTKSWKDGNDTKTGLTKGAMSGAVSAVTWAGISKIGEIVPGTDKTSKVVRALYRGNLTADLGLANMFVDAYDSKTYIDDAGVKKEFTEDATYGKKLKEVYDDKGGLKTVAIEGGVGAMNSFVTDSDILEGLSSKAANYSYKIPAEKIRDVPTAIKDKDGKDVTIDTLHKIKDPEVRKDIVKEEKEIIKEEKSLTTDKEEKKELNEQLDRVNKSKQKIEK